MSHNLIEIRLSLRLYSDHQAFAARAPESLAQSGYRLSRASAYLPAVSRPVKEPGRALTDLGVNAGDVVAVLEWDSHRYH